MHRRQNVSNELILEIANKSRLDSSFILLMTVAGILTAVSFLTNSIPVLLGAMVIAPALPPLALVVFAFAGGQPKLALRAVGIVAAGIIVAVLGAILVTWLLQWVSILTPGEQSFHPLLEERVRPGWYSAIVALAAGVAGVIGTARRRTDVLIGTVSAVALVPAACAAGISLAAGDSAKAGGGLVLLLVNIMLILAGGLLTVAFLKLDIDETESSTPGVPVVSRYGNAEQK